MYRRRLFTTLAAIALMANSAFAETVADQISRQLRDQGFAKVTVTQTWLGRTRIIGQSSKGQREIIINPKTGEILRDLFTGAGGGASSPVIGNTGSGNDNSGSGNSDSDDDEGDDNSGSGGNDDDDEDEEEDDNSGSGGGSDDDDSDDDEDEDDSDSDDDN